MTAADVRDVEIGEVANELGESVWFPLRVRVRERDDVGVGSTNRQVLRGDLAAARAPQQPHARLACGHRVDERISGVCGCVRRDDDLESVWWVVQLEQIPQPP